MIYLASPYTDPDPAVQEARYRAVCVAAAELHRAGHLVYSPIAHSHGIAKHGGIQGDWETFSRVDTWMLHRCRSVLVLMLPGWADSVGVVAETREAQFLSLAVNYLNPSPAVLAELENVELRRDGNGSQNATEKESADNCKMPDVRGVG